MAGIGSGTVVDGGVSTPFSGVSFSVTALGDTSTYYDNTGVAHGTFVSTASITADGHTALLDVQPGEFFFVTEGANPGVAGFGNLHNSSMPGYILAASNFDSYDAVSDTGPFSIDVLKFDDLQTKAGPDIFFDSINRATFTAFVPEPATWAMMLVGFGGLGALLRRRARTAVAAV